MILRDLIDVADQRFENKRDRVEQNTDQAIKDLEERLNKKVQMALDNPLAN
jgi:vacuolar-type H+-ATPase subunit H